eukprot:CAMPEP_0185256912 /NCGR_PEP_ID=MMETSP1359-20130426/5973_1 /TAXON_ID=552665 /ORGANISM="Bigelowiella longifila, Strain CCMP242" /LENGTH=300 /DNA_ID=CAMNT_0027841715 /DNA_START=676 /DNA_END=1578 /DNA_ORIENTATION=-
MEADMECQFPFIESEVKSYVDGFKQRSFCVHEAAMRVELLGISKEIIDKQIVKDTPLKTIRKGVKRSRLTKKEIFTSMEVNEKAVDAVSPGGVFNQTEDLKLETQNVQNRGFDVPKVKALHSIGNPTQWIKVRQKSLFNDVGHSMAFSDTHSSSRSENSVPFNEGRLLPGSFCQNTEDRESKNSFCEDSLRPACAIADIVPTYSPPLVEPLKFNHDEISSTQPSDAPFSTENKRRIFHSSPQFQKFGQPHHNSMQEGVARIRISSNSLWNPHENSASTESHLNLDSIVFPEQQNFDNPFS